MDSIDRKIIAATQGGLPLTRHPYRDVAHSLGLGEEDVIERMKNMFETGIIRRIGAVPNHYKLGLSANGMSVWDVPDERIEELGKQIGALEFVSHCYHRPRHLPLWSYNLFAMVHGKNRGEVEEKIEKIARLLGDDDNGHEVLYSTKILKKTGLRLAS